jgi:hypothetical protein
MDLKDAPTVIAVISDSKFLTQTVERKDVSNAARIIIYWGSTEIGFLRGVERPFVAMHANRMLRRTDVRDMFRTGE